MASPQGYSLRGYGEFIANGARMRPYAEALARAVQPGSILLDIGAGTGIFSLLGCRFGAAQVHAVEPDESIAIARRIAEANGYGERIRFHQGLSTEVSLSARADVMVSDLRGALPLFQRHIPAIVDARARLLAPGGQLIPRADHLWASLVQAPEEYRPFHEPWLRNAYELDMSAGQPLVVNRWHKSNFKAEQLLVAPQSLATLDYRVIEQANLAADLAWILDRPGRVHGLALWFDAELHEGIGFSNAPGQPELIYGQAFFPMQNPVDLAIGDEVKIRLRADLVGEDYIWQWRTRIEAAGGGASRPKAAFDQSTFQGTPIDPRRLHRRLADSRPSLNDRGQVEHYILSRMDGRATLGAIARAAALRFPQRFATLEAALEAVRELTEKYAR